MDHLRIVFASLAVFPFSVGWVNESGVSSWDGSGNNYHSVKSSVQETSSNPRDKEFEYNFQNFSDHVFCDLAGIDIEHRLRIKNIIQSYSAKYVLLAEEDSRKPIRERLHYQCLSAIEETCTEVQLAAIQYLRICSGFQHPAIQVVRHNVFSSDFDLSAEQTSKLDKIAAQWIEMVVEECVPKDKQQLPLTNQELLPIYQSMKKYSEGELFVNKFQVRVLEVLTASQQERLQELEFQWRLIRHGPRAFVNPKITALLELSEMQLDFISGLASVSREWVNREQRNGDFAKIVEQLSTDQLTKCSKLLGTIHPWNEGWDSMGLFQRFKNTP
jgi:hypothetical protein